MYKDKDYYIKDRFRQYDAVEEHSLSTLFRLKSTNSKVSRIDPDLRGRSSYGTILLCPPGLEPICNLKKIYLYKHMETLKQDIDGSYFGEIINEDGLRIFVIKRAAHFDSDEVVNYGKFKKITIRGKFCYGIVNYSGTQIFQIYGDPERVIRIGPNATGIWGEIQVLPGSVWDKLPCICSCLCCYYCLHPCKHKTHAEEQMERHKQHKKDKDQDAEIRVVVLKKDNGPKPIPGQPFQPIFKHVYTLRGTLSHGCHHQQDNIFYKKKFDLKIYDKDIFEEHAEEEDESTSGDEEREEHHVHIGRIRSNSLHEKLNCQLPTLELPQQMDIYDKITLMGMFFFFSIKL